MIPDDRYTLTAAVKQDARALVFGSPEAQSDLDLSIAAVTQSGRVLEHLSEEISRDRRVVLAAVRQSGYALRHAPTSLTGDRDLEATDVADVVLFMSSPLSDLVQGQTLIVDGGTAIHI